MALMRDPVVGPDGHTYERSAIEAWLQQNPISPMTREPMTVAQLKTNYALRASIERYMSSGASSTVSTIQLPPQPAPNTLIVGVIDTSGSMSEATNEEADAEGLVFTRMQLTKHSLRTVAGMCSEVPGTALCLVSFNSMATRILPPTLVSDSTAHMIDSAIDSLRPGGATNIWDGLRVALDEIRAYQSIHRDVVVNILLLTDGEPTLSMNPPQGIQAALKAGLSYVGNTTVSSFGFGYNLDSDLLVELSEVGSGVFGYIPDCSMVATVFINYCSHILSQRQETVKLSVEEQDLVSMIAETLRGITKTNPTMDWTAIKEVLANHTNPLAQALLEDIEHESEHKGQLTKALSRPDWFKSWGYNHILAYRRALEQKVCINFKDQALQRFTTLRFKELQSQGNMNFATLPPPIPRGHTTASFAQTNFSMTSFNTADGGCFSGDNVVRMADGSAKFVADCIKGDLVWTPSGPASIVCVVRRKVGRSIKMVKFPGGLQITPWHPVRPSGQLPWVFPCLWLGKVTMFHMEHFYDFVLDKHHVVDINNMEVITLGHGFQEPVAKHEFYGTEKIIDDLKTQRGWEIGYVEL